MPADEYATVGGRGALKLKGAKVKKKHKKKDQPASLEKALSTGPPPAATAGADEEEVNPRQGSAEGGDGGGKPEEEEDNATGAPAPKTEAERRFAEAKRKKLLETTRSAAARPELLKTHKQRVEELNTYLSKLSEHHDMPKIGPG